VGWEYRLGISAFHEGMSFARDHLNQLASGRTKSVFIDEIGPLELMDRASVMNF
jgi:nucleoside-triphosphatase THEP1